MPPRHPHNLRRGDAIRPVHTAVRGRGRFHVDGLAGSELLEEYLKARLTEKREYVRFSVSAVTGNVLVLFDAGASHAAVAATLKEFVQDYCKLSPPLPSDRTGQNKGPSAPEHGKEGPVDRLKSVIARLVRHEETPPWHLLDAGDVLVRQNVVRETGLSSDEAARRIRTYGPNTMPEAEPRSGWSIFLGQLVTIPVALLGVAAGISIVTGGMADAVVILSVVFINAGIGFATERQTERTISSLKSRVSPTATVVRDGLPGEIRAEGVAPGDVILLKPGSYIPADCRILGADNLSVDESLLTGEVLPVYKDAATLSDQALPLADRLNMAFTGTMVTGGQGVAVVVATGRSTEFGRLQTLVEQSESPETPMERQLDVLGRRLVVLSGATCGLVFVIGLARGYGLARMLSTSISLAVAAVPEGLPTVATTTLALGVRRMRAHHVLVRKLDAVETLGGVQTVCFDKTGTVTMNRIRVRELFVDSRRIEAKGGFVESGGPVSPQDIYALKRLIKAGVLCSETRINGGKGKGSLTLEGSATENALIALAMEAGMDPYRIRAKRALLDVRHRSQDRQYMVTTHESSQGRLLMVKGNPMDVLDMCGRRLRGKEAVSLTPDHRRRILAENDRMAASGMRVLGFATSGGRLGRGETAEGMVWLGLAGMEDPVRPGAKDLMDKLHRAGIRTVMITGDQRSTAESVAGRLRLGGADAPRVFESSVLDDASPEGLKTLARQAHAFARVSPPQKLKIVRAFQAGGQVVAMTGDGINDSPSLKAADVGIAMGASGTDFAREVADVVLENDDLETLVIAVSDGRTIRDNIRKSLHFLLSTNLSEIVVMASALLLGMGQPLNTMQLLWINLISDIFPGLALSQEPAEPGVLDRPPSPPDKPLVDEREMRAMGRESMVISASALAAYGAGLLRYGQGRAASTMGFQALVAGQLLQGFSSRSAQSLLGGAKLPPNPYLGLAIGGSLAIQLLTVFVPPLRRLLGLAPLSLIDGLIAAGAAGTQFFAVELLKNGRPGRAGAKKDGPGQRRNSSGARVRGYSARFMKRDSGMLPKA